MKDSQVFASIRQAVIHQLMLEIEMEVLPAFQYELSEIQREYDETITRAQQAEASKENWAKPLAQQAVRQRQARVMDLQRKTRMLLRDYDTSMKDTIARKLNEMQGEVFESEEKSTSGVRKVLRAKFKDGSVSKVPKTLHINYSEFNL